MFAVARSLRIARKPIREALIDQAFSNTPPSHKWKHCATNFEDVSSFTDTLVVFCVRNPASWLLALQRKPYHAKNTVPQDFGTFLKMKWPTLGRENLEKYAPTPVELYNEKIKSYSNLIKKLDERKIKWTLVKFEDFAADQEFVFEALRPHLPHPERSFTPITRSTKEKGKDLEFYKTYYGRELWKNEIQKHDVRALKKSIDWSLASSFGYEEDCL